jgi:hypothetical protein
MPLFVDTATVVSSRHVTSNEFLGKQVISLSNVPSSLRITSIIYYLSLIGSNMNGRVHDMTTNRMPLDVIVSPKLEMKKSITTSNLN